MLREEEEKDVSSYLLTLKKRQITGNCNTQRYIELCAELA
jgi:hypothetical protein